MEYLCVTLAALAFIAYHYFATGWSVSMMMRMRMRMMLTRMMMMIVTMIMIMTMMIIPQVAGASAAGGPASDVGAPQDGSALLPHLLRPDRRLDLLDRRHGPVVSRGHHHHRHGHHHIIIIIIIIIIIS
jgi:hypothetical protein